MDPITSATGAAKIVVDYGTLGAVLLGAAVIVAGLIVAVVVLWHSRELLEKKREDAQAAHYLWAVDMVAKQAEREHHLADALQSHAVATVTVRDLLSKVLERLANGRD